MKAAGAYASAAFGISAIFMRSLIAMLTEPPVAWKNEPCGRESMTVALAVVEAVAPAIKIPETGASTNAGRSLF